MGQEEPREHTLGKLQTEGSAVPQHGLLRKEEEGEHKRVNVEKRVDLQGWESGRHAGAQGAEGDRKRRLPQI